MFNIDMFLSPDERKKKHDREMAYRRERVKTAVDWSPNIKFEQSLAIKASTYTVRNIFPEVAKSGRSHFDAANNPTLHLLSRDGQWLYVNKRLPALTSLSCAQGNRSGTVIFDGPVIVPCLFTKDRHGDWESSPFMSLTPMEFFTLRPGTRFAKGHTVIAGLGLGHQLIEASLRKHVERITLVEISQSLVDMVLPRVLQHCDPRVKVEVIVGDAEEEVPKLKADVALIDIFPKYGGNFFRPKCHDIKLVWCWGSSWTG